jgi:hypothetical protein
MVSPRSSSTLRWRRVRDPVGSDRRVTFREAVAVSPSRSVACASTVSRAGEYRLARKVWLSVGPFPRVYPPTNHW